MSTSSESPGRSLRGLVSSLRASGYAVRQVLGDQRLGQPHDALLVGVADDERPVSVGQEFAQRGDLADRFERAGLDDGQCLVEADRLALPQRRRRRCSASTSGASCDPR